MLSSQKRSLVRFLIIYLLSTLTLFVLALWLFYSFTKEHLLDQQRDILIYEANHIKSQLRELHQSDANRLFYPKSKDMKSAIYDLDREYIFGTLDKSVTLDSVHDTNKMHVILNVEPYYLGAAYLLVAKEIDFQPIDSLQKEIVIFMLVASIFFTILGYYLGGLFIAPMRESIERMNYFIQDATHELNTPISTILTNIEMIESLDKNLKNSQELKRIEVASKTLSRIYDDLAYLNLNHDYYRYIESVDIGSLAEQRIEYFRALAKAKELKIDLDIESDVVLQIDRNDAIRLLDNLISNAIKYNRVGGSLHIRVIKNALSVKDSGVGINEKDLLFILERFRRANKSEGGFGIGLNIVNHVVGRYGFDLKINSKNNQGTEVVIRW